MSFRLRPLIIAFSLTAAIPSLGTAQAQSASHANGLTAFWPLDSVDGKRTFDLVRKTPLRLRNMDESNLTSGRHGRALTFDGQEELLSHTYADSPFLPISQSDAFSITLWVKGTGPGQADKRIFSEGSTKQDTPLFNLGTDVNGQNKRLDLFIRSSNGNTPVSHRQSRRAVFDNEWHHVAWVDINGSARLYIDGVRDKTDFQYDKGHLDLNTLSIGGILRESPCCFFEGRIDSVALWESALTPTQIGALADGVLPTDLGKAPPTLVGQDSAKKYSLLAGSPKAEGLTLAAQVAGTPPFQFQWHHDGTAIPQATNRVLRFDKLTPEDSGTYSVDIRNELGKAAAKVAGLDIKPAYYRLETIPIPDDIVLEVGGMDFMSDGRLMVATRRGDIWALKNGRWNRFARGLDEPMGVCATGANEIVVAQRPELTRITDTDNDGKADLYRTITDRWGYTGHMYEWAFGPVQDPQGNLWGTLAYWFFPSEQYQQPPYKQGDVANLLRLGYIKPPTDYTPNPKTAYRGWCFKVTPEGDFIPWSTGLRSPNGIGVSPAGEVFVADNQGEYFGTSPMHHISRDAFHGHPIGLLWDDRFSGDPTQVPIEQLEAEKKPAAIRFPYGAMGQSISQPVWDTTGGKFGPFESQIFVGDQTKSMVMRATLEKVQGTYQGACYPFRKGFQCGVNRLVFSPTGQLYAGETDRGWGAVGSEPFGLQRLVWSGDTPMEIAEMRLTDSGFALDFTKPVRRQTAQPSGNYRFTHYRYKYHRSYGSPQIDKETTEVAKVRVSKNRKTVFLTLPNLVPGKIYQLDVANLRAEDGSRLRHSKAYYTLNRLKQTSLE